MRLWAPCGWESTEVPCLVNSWCARAVPWRCMCACPSHLMLHNPAVGTPLLILWNPVVTIYAIFFNIMKLHSTHRVYFYVSHGSHNKQWLFLRTVLTSWSLEERHNVFSVRHELILIYFEKSLYRVRWVMNHTRCQQVGCGPPLLVKISSISAFFLMYF